MPDDHSLEDEHKELLLEEIELRSRSRELNHAFAMKGLQARRALILGDLKTYSESMLSRNDIAAQIKALSADIRDYNSRARAHMGLHPDGPDIPQGLKEFLADRFPGSIVIEVGGGSFPFGGIDLTDAQAAGFLRNLPPFPDNAPEETEPTDAPAASWFDENQHQGFGPG